MPVRESRSGRAEPGARWKPSGMLENRVPIPPLSATVSRPALWPVTRAFLVTNPARHAELFDLQEIRLD